MLKATAKALNIMLIGSLSEYAGCMVANGIRAPIAKQTSNRSDTNLRRIFVHLSWGKEFPALAGKRHVIVFGNNS